MDNEVKSRWHEVKTMAYCTTYSKTFKSSRALNVHIGKLHSQPNSAKVNEVLTQKCTINSKSSNTKTTSVKCSLCDKQFSSKQALGLHIRHTPKHLDSDDDVGHLQHADVEPNFEQSTNSSHNIGIKTFPCKVCKKSLRHNHTLKRHKTRKRKMCGKMLRCGICNNTFDSQHGLEKLTTNVHQ